MNGGNTALHVSAREAAAQVGYSADYVTRLAREGKITAARAGRQWLVDPISLANFIEEVEQEKRARQEELSLQRREELKHIHLQMQRSPQKSASNLYHKCYRIGAGVIACALFILGGWLAMGAIPEITQLASVVLSAAEPPLPTEHTTPDSLILLPPTTTAEEAAAIADSFSDEVTVEFENDRTGIITPQFKNKREESYRFLLVPVNHPGG